MQNRKSNTYTHTRIHPYNVIHTIQYNQQSKRDCKQKIEISLNRSIRSSAWNCKSGTKSQQLQIKFQTTKKICVLFYFT